MSNDRISLVQRRLNEIWRDHLMNHRSLSVEIPDAIVAEARRLYTDLADPGARVSTYRRFLDRGLCVADEAPLLPRARFGGEFMLGREDQPLWIPGYDNGQSWNGWREPLLERDTVEEIRAFMSGGDYATWEWDGATLVVTYADAVAGVDEPQRIEPDLIATEDGDRLLYNVGLGIVWELVPEPDAIRWSQRAFEET